ncbi:MAG: winged helix-turn-helix domain-containing protein [Nitrososphaera sp.]|uniref:ArnR1-like winged helix-turn-helix domain-containing protein n=1 Tax=Nitrososphaera gargensis (strain Ga9.2) TaxID=1237085 RepID=K0IHH9_NITGG|nr:winged helix-turn-helix domain-containing protein [Candidatus Nitrososphaera gargensis]AFU58358.1 hypothetical protein Ngar_c14220 [Candidatus Nitrososphaera gargensis Ga9.2]
MKYRSRTETIAQILGAAKGGTSKTKIMYKAYIGYEKLIDYLELLIDNGLIYYDDKTKVYVTTHKGLLFIEKYIRMAELMGTT